MLDFWQIYFVKTESCRALLVLKDRSVIFGSWGNILVLFLHLNLRGHLWMTPPSNDGARGLSPKWGSARVSSLNFSRNVFKLGVAMGTVINRQDFLPITHSGITWFGLVTWKKEKKRCHKKIAKISHGILFQNLF